MLISIYFVLSRPACTSLERYKTNRIIVAATSRKLYLKFIIVSTKVWGSTPYPCKKKKKIYLTKSLEFSKEVCPVCQTY